MPVGADPEGGGIREEAFSGMQRTPKLLRSTLIVPSALGAASYFPVTDEWRLPADLCPGGLPASSNRMDCWKATRIPYLLPLGNVG